VNGSGPLIGRRRFLRGAGLLGAGVVVAPLLQACSEAALEQTDVLSFLNWQDYIDPSTISQFESSSGISVTYQTYSSNDELAKLMTLANSARRRGRESKNYDLIVPSDNFVRRFQSQKQIVTLDRDKLTNLGNLAPEFRNEGFDPGNRYTVPWATGTTGIGYDTTVFPEPPDWNVFADEAHTGKMSVLAEVRDAFLAALLSLGEDPNTTDPSTITAAADRLVEWKKVIAGFDSATYLDRLASGSLVAAEAYSSDVLEAKDRNPNLAFVIPAQGGGRWVDSLAKPVNAAHEDNSEIFINYYLRPEVSAQIANFVKVDTGNAKAVPLMDPAVRDNPVVFPPADVLAKAVFTQDVGDAEKLYQDEWSRVQSA
jgi:putrescine transport system substrate-binding protein